MTRVSPLPADSAKTLNFLPDVTALEFTDGVDDPSAFDVSDGSLGVDCVSELMTPPVGSRVTSHLLRTYVPFSVLTYSDVNSGNCLSQLSTVQRSDSRIESSRITTALGLRCECRIGNAGCRA